MYTWKSFLKGDFVPEWSLLHGLRVNFCGSIAPIQPYPFVLFRDRNERPPSWSLPVHGVVPNNVVVRLTVAVGRVDKHRQAVEGVTVVVTYKCNRAGYS